MGNPNDVAASFHPPYPEMKRIITETTAVWVPETWLTPLTCRFGADPSWAMIRRWRCG